MASTVPGYSITEVRRVLDKVRTQWHQRLEEPFSLHKSVSDQTEDTIMTFCTKFMRGHQRKRHARRKRSVGKKK